MKLALGVLSATIITIAAMFAIANHEVAKEDKAKAAKAVNLSICRTLLGPKQCPVI